MCEDCGSTPLTDTSEQAGFSRRRLLGATGAAVASAGLVAATGCSAAAPTAGPAPRRDQSRPPLELVLLGTFSGPPVDPYRKGTASALVVDGSTYVVDCGRSSVTQYVEAGLRLDSLRSIFITHLHADHVADYYNFIMLGALPNMSGDAIRTIDVYGPGRAGGLPPKFGGGQAGTVNPTNPTPGITDLTNSCTDAFAYSTNVFLRDSGIRDPRRITTIHDIVVPEVGASYQNTAPDMAPFVVMQDDKVKVTAILVPHGPVFPAFAYRFDTAYGSVTFSGDTTYSTAVPRLAANTDILVHEAENLEGYQGPPALADHLRKSHTEVQRVGEIAHAANAGQLVLTHIADLTHNPIPVPQWWRWAQQGYGRRVTVGGDLQRITV